VDRRRTSAAPPPDSGGHAQCLEAGQALVLGATVGTGEGRPNATQSLPPGSTLTALHRRPGRDPGSRLGTGLDRLRRHALTLAHAPPDTAPLDTLCDQLLALARMPPGNTDDMALLALRLPTP
jgi:hypothetical protein